MVFVGFIIDVKEIVKVVVLLNILIVFVIVLGVVGFIMLVVRIMKFYFVEVVIIVGFCMVNRGGVGDVVVLGVVDRMDFMLFV